MNSMNPACLSTRDGSDVLLEGVKASGDLRGVLLDMRVEQRFRNSTGKNIEIVYPKFGSSPHPASLGAGVGSAV